MNEIIERRDPDSVRRILQALPEWFGDPDAIENYIEAAGSGEYDSIVTIRAGEVVGVALVRRHFAQSAELHLIAIAPKSRGHGLGKALILEVSERLRADGCLMLSVHTVGPSFVNEPYAHTRAFYEAVDFVPLEEHLNLDWPGPTLILVRDLRGHVEAV